MRSNNVPFRRQLMRMVSAGLILCSVPVLAQQSASDTDSTFDGLLNSDSLASGSIDFSSVMKGPRFGLNRAYNHAAKMPTVTLSQLLNRKGINSIRPNSSRGVMSILPSGNDPWINMGPNSMLSNETAGFGGTTATGRVNAAVFHPTDSKTIYLATANGGIWKTINKGVVWTPLTDKVAGGNSFSSITIDPSDYNVIYAGTGDYDGTEASGFGLLKSQNGGTTWELLGADIFGDHAIRKVLINPAHPHVVYVALGRNLDLGKTRLPRAQFVSSCPGHVPSRAPIRSSRQKADRWSVGRLRTYRLGLHFRRVEGL